MRIELRVPSDFKSNEKYDLVLNVDSLTEIGKMMLSDILKLKGNFSLY